MTTPFERIPPVPDADEVLDAAFAKASRVSETNSGVDSQRGMTAKASNRVSSRLGNVVEGFPSFDRLDGFYLAVASAAVDIDEVRQALSSVDWAAEQVESIADDAQSEMADASTDAAIGVRKRAFARISSVVEDVADDLDTLRDARQRLVYVPEVRDLPTAVLAGAPNVGKSTVLDALTRAEPEVAGYAFTTKGVGMGHIEENHRTYQIVDTPGLLDRPADERNEMEQQAVEALEHLADLVVFVLDPTETCGYTVEEQEALLDEVRELGASVLVVSNKADLGETYDADVTVSATEDTDELRDAILNRLSARDYQKP
ncbi:MAG: NOG1 family protein [Halobacteriales archaeon]